MIAARYTLSQQGFTSKKQNHYVKSKTRVEAGDVCHIPQPDFFCNVFLASCQGCVSQGNSGLPYRSHSFLPMNCAFRGQRGWLFLYF